MGLGSERLGELPDGGFAFRFEDAAILAALFGRHARSVTQGGFEYACSQADDLYSAARTQPRGGSPSVGSCSIRVPYTLDMSSMVGYRNAHA